MPDVAHVHPDLVRSARLERYTQQRCVSQYLADSVMGHRAATALDDRHGRPMSRMPADGSVYRPFPLRGDPPDDGQVVPVNTARLEVCGEFYVRRVRFRRNQ